ncbi:MAG: hypothetical protein ACXITV_02455 [Luteibaculaceae bacterium]
MKKLILIFTVLMLGALFLVSSCTREVEGPPGRDGNANVNSRTVTINPNDWIIDGNSQIADIIMPTLTADILNNGAVLAYMEFGSNIWLHLPTTIQLFDEQAEENFFVTLEVESSIGLVSIYWSELDLEFLASNPGTQRFRIVTIGGNSLRESPEVDFSNYNQVKEVFQIAD